MSHHRIKGHPAAALIGRVPDGVVAAIVGCSPEGVGYHRRRLSAPVVGPEWVDDWQLCRDVLAVASAEAAAVPMRAERILERLGRYMPIEPRDG